MIIEIFDFYDNGIFLNMNEQELENAQAVYFVALLFKH